MMLTNINTRNASPRRTAARPEVFEAPFSPIPAGKGGAHAFVGAFRRCCHDYSYCSRYLRTTCKAMTFKPRVTTKKHQAQRKRGQRLGTIELLIAGQQGDDLNRDGGNRPERIGREVRG